MLCHLRGLLPVGHILDALGILEEGQKLLDHVAATPVNKYGGYKQSLSFSTEA